MSSKQTEAIHHFSQQFAKNLGFSPTADQELAIRALSEFLFVENQLNIFLLGGYAGTGKTSLIGALVRTLAKTGMKSVLMAPTGRAAKVMSSFSGKSASTVHRKIYSFGEDTGGGYQFMPKENKLKNGVFIVDEASMITASENPEKPSLLYDLIEYVYSAPGCKLIFVGDIGQLPPIGLDFSPALNKKYLLDELGFQTITSLLSEILRQESDSGILHLSAQLRKFAPEIPALFSNQLDVVRIDSMDLQDEIESSFSAFGRENVMIVCRSNKQANLYNRQIRNRIFWYEEELNAGDTAMALSNNYFWLDEKSEAGFIANGQMMEIQKIAREEEKYGCRFADAVVRFPDYPEMPAVEIKILLDSLYVDSPSLSQEKLRDLYNAITAAEYAGIANKRERRAKMRLDPYFQAVQVKFGYAVTCNKAQGGQWDAVFVDPGYFTTEMWDRNYMRWLYTAITRAKKKLYLVNLSPAFGPAEDSE